MLNAKTTVIPVIKGANGTISKSCRKYLSNLPTEHDIKELHTSGSTNVKRTKPSTHVVTTE